MSVDAEDTHIEDPSFSSSDATAGLEATRHNSGKKHDPLDAIRSILLERDRDQIGQLSESTRAEISALEQRIEHLRSQLALLESNKADFDQIIPHIESSLSEITRQAIEDNQPQMAKALAPVIGEATRLQIAESKDDVVQAISPIMFDAIRQAIRDGLQDLQRQIDQRLRRQVNPRNIFRRASARMRGVSSAEIALRDALPFQIQQIFLIQHASGLLIAHYAADDQPTDSDLISAMLTAIRDFVGDAFQNPNVEEHIQSELNEVQFGGASIIIKSGEAAYVALVLDGIEPEGLRSRLQEFVVNLHLRHGEEMSLYYGDPDTLTNLQPQLAEFATGVTNGSSLTLPQTRDEIAPRTIMGIGCGLISLLATICFISWFIFSLVPVAASSWQPTSTPMTIVATATPVPTETPQPPATNTLQPTEASTKIPTETPTEVSTATSTPIVVSSDTPTAIPPTETSTTVPEPTSTPTPPRAYAFVNVWARSEPSNDSGSLTVAIQEGKELTILAVNNSWMLVSLQQGDENREGWIEEQYLVLPDPIPSSIVTPAADN